MTKNSKKIGKRLLFFLVAALAVGTVLFCNYESAFADGWIGSGDLGGGGASSGGNTGGGANCYAFYSKADKRWIYNAWRYQDDCAGWSWVRYEFSDYYKNNKSTVFELMREGTKKGSGYGYYDEGISIPNKCAEEGYTGFWHSGLNGFMEPGVDANPPGTFFNAINGGSNVSHRTTFNNLLYAYHGDYSGSFSGKTSGKNAYDNTTGNGWGHWQTVTPSKEAGLEWLRSMYKSTFSRSLNKYNRGETEKMNFNGTHIVEIGGHEAWHSVEVSDGYTRGSAAYEDYDHAYYEENGFHPEDSFIPANVWGFCAGAGSQKNTIGSKVNLVIAADGKTAATLTSSNWDTNPSDRSIEITSGSFSVDVQFFAHRWPMQGSTINWKTHEIKFTYGSTANGASVSSNTLKNSYSFNANADGGANGLDLGHKKYTFSLEPGGSVYICESMGHPWQFDQKGNETGKGGSKACFTVKRKHVENDVDTVSTLKVIEASKTSNSKSATSNWDTYSDFANDKNYVLTTTSSLINLEFSNEARRVGSSFAFAAPDVDATYQYRIYNEKWSDWTNWSPLATTAKTKIQFAKNVSSVKLGQVNKSLTIYLDPGQSKQVCARIKHLSKVSSGNKSAYGADEYSTVCLKVVRKNRTASFEGTITLKASEVGGNASITSSDTKTHRLEVNTEEYKVTSTAQMKRSGGDSGWSASSSWSTKAERNNEEGDLSKGKNQSNKFTKDKNSSLETLPGFSYDYTKTDGKNGKIYPGQEVTYCETLSYKSKVSENGKEDGDGTAKACLTIYRPKVPCSTLKGTLENAVFYSYMEGFNYGQIGVKNNTAANKNIAKDTYVYPEGKYGSGTISIYARPGDNIKYEHNLCAGGYYTLAMRKLGGKTTYAPSGTSTSAATNKGNYLFGEELSTWNETSKKSTAKTINFLKDDDVKTAKIEQTLKSPDNNSEDYKNCGTGGKKGFDNLIGTTAAAEATSCSGKTNRIQTLDVGHTISQTLTWTQKGYKDGATTSGTDLKATGKVVVPYNYVLQPYVQNDSSSEAETRAFIGGEVNMTPGVVVLPRKNTAFADGYQEYATITKETHIRVKSYALHTNGSKTDLGTTEYAKQRLNQAGNLNGTGNVESSYKDGGRVFPTVNIPIYDDNFSVGDKVCVEVSVYPFDSHDTPLNSIVSGATAVNGAPTLSGKTPALMEGSTYDSETRRLEFSCVTVAKRPTMSVESSNAYSATTYNMSQYNKRRNASDTSKYNFGSWSEYGVYGRVQSGKMFASGAALGYSRAVNNSTRSLNPPRAQTSNGVSRSSNSNDCTFMTQTFANIDTSGNVCKGAQTEIGGVTATQYAARIKERYASTSGIDITKYSSYKSSYAGGTVWSVKNVNEAAAIQKVSGIVSIRAGSDGTGDTLFIDGTPAIYSNDGEFANRNVQNRNRTIVYRADNVIIDSNVNVDMGNKRYLRDINNVVIIAQNVYVTNKPTYINATIIASKSLNTCKYTNGREMVMGKASGNQLALSSQQCSQQLVFDGPVVVNGKLTLNRTHGAGKGDNSIVRGEVFNLNSMNYLWSFGQMSRNSQAVTTYSRELPPRY